VIGADAARSDRLLFKPSAKTRREQNLPMDRVRSVSLFTQRFGKRTDMSREWAVRRSRKNYLAIDDAIHGGLLPRLFGLVKGARLCLSDLKQLPETPGYRSVTRHSQEG
jgi:hypothetical protein